MCGAFVGTPQDRTSSGQDFTARGGNSATRDRETPGVVADGGEEPGLVTAEVDLERLWCVRQELPMLAHRRPDLYGAVARESVRL